MNKAEIMKEFRLTQESISNSSWTNRIKFEATRQLVIDTELALKELKENENS